MDEGKDWRSAAAIVLLASADVLADEARSLETVIVHASKREMALQHVPMSVNVLTATDLERTGIDDVAGVANYAPTFDRQHAVTVTTTTFRIRRIGSLGNVHTFEPAVGLFVDGAYRSRSLLGTNELLDVESIEILSGPQSTLYGKNVSAGLIAIYTQPPSAQFAGRAEATTGQYDTEGSPTLNKLRFRASGPLADGWGASIAAAGSWHEHTLTNAIDGAPDANGEDRYALRGQLQWFNDTALDVRLIAGYARDRSDQGEPDVYLAPGSPSSRTADLFQATGAAPACEDNVPHNRKFCSLGPNKVDLKAFDLTLLGTYRLPNQWSLNSITAWDQYEALRDDDDSAQVLGPLFFFHDSEEGSSVQQELRLTSAPGAGAPWLAGVTYYRNDYDRGMQGRRPMFGKVDNAAFDAVWPAVLGVPAAQASQFGIHDSYLDSRYVGVFGNVTWPVANRLSVSTGVRWQREEKRAEINNSITAPGPSLISVVLTPAATPTGEPVNGRLERASDDVTWSVTPQFRIDERSMAYLTIARGSKSGGFNTGQGRVPLAQREFDDERVISYELGARGMFFDGRLRFSAAAFYAEYEDFQDAAYVSSQFSVGNADRVELKGAELEGTLTLGRRLAIDVALSLADLAYAKNTTGMCYPGRSPDGTAPNSCVLSGERPINAPVWAAHVGTWYEHAMRWGALFGRVDWSWTDRYNTSFSADPRLVQDAHSLIGVRLGARFGAAYELILWGDNLLDETVSTLDAVHNLFNDTSYQSFLEPPRSYGMTLRVAF